MPYFIQLFLKYVQYSSFQLWSTKASILPLASKSRGECSHVTKCIRTCPPSRGSHARNQLPMIPEGQPMGSTRAKQDSLLQGRETLCKMFVFVVCVICLFIYWSIYSFVCLFVSILFDWSIFHVSSGGVELQKPRENVASKLHQIPLPHFASSTYMATHRNRCCKGTSRGWS